VANLGPYSIVVLFDDLAAVANRAGWRSVRFLNRHPNPRSVWMIQKWPLVRFGLFPRSPLILVEKTNPWLSNGVLWRAKMGRSSGLFFTETKISHQEIGLSISTTSWASS